MSKEFYLPKKAKTNKSTKGNLSEGDQPRTWQTPGLTLIHRVHKGYRIENAVETPSVMKRYGLDMSLCNRGYMWCAVQEGVLNFYHVGEWMVLNPESMATKYRPVTKGIKKMHKKLRT